MKQEFKLPAVKDIVNSDLIRLDEINDLNILLNQDPPQKWLKVHPIAKTKYIPIEKIEYLLTKLFFQWRVEIKNTQLIGNSVCIEIRLHYFNIVSNEWEWQDGVGASPLQTEKGASSTDLNKLKSSAVMIAAPAAKTFAVKDAAEQIGKIFGKDLNRSDAMSYNNLHKNEMFNEDKYAGKFDEDNANS